jgi:hypothetical protein
VTIRIPKSIAEERVQRKGPGGSDVGKLLLCGLLRNPVLVEDEVGGRPGSRIGKELDLCIHDLQEEILSDSAKRNERNSGPTKKQSPANASRQMLFP